MDLREQSTIFERIGGTETVRAVVDDFYRRVLADEALAPAFAGVDLDRLRQHQLAFLATALGAESTYLGRSMQAAHRGLNITRRHFAGVAAHLHEALRGRVGEEQIEAILATVASLQDDIVGR